jgi:dsRNA-specific ribonuclease
MYLPFEHTKMVYPPSDVYPPPIPRLRDVDLDTAARALAVLRTSGVQWIQDKERRASVANGDSVLLGTGQWRSVVRDADWLVNHSEMDRLDSEQSLEYIGDSLLHLLSRSALMNRYPRRTMILYNIGANFLVSNDVFGHVYRDSGLDDERKIVAHLVQSRSKAAELNRVKDIISPQEYEERASMPLPPLAFPPIHHLRQADLFEAYVGGVYLTLGFNEASKWCTRLFQPWLDRLGRTPGFNAPRFLTPDGELHARLQLSMRNQVEQDLRDRSERELSKIGGMQKWLIRILQRVSGRQVYLDDRSKERV